MANSIITITVPRLLADKRSDSVLTELLNKKLSRGKPFTRGFVARLIKKGAVLRNGIATDPDTPVRSGDVFEVAEEALGEPDLTLKKNPDLPIRVIAEDDEVLIIDKPAGIQVHPAGRYQEDTLANWLAVRLPQMEGVEGDGSRPGIVHRLDRETSGIMVIAKTAASFAALKELFQSRRVAKTYVALVSGHLSQREGIVDAPLIRREGSLRRSVASEKTKHDKGVRPAVTHYRVMARTPLFDVLSLAPKTGRTHQIRVHMASLGHPVLGDKLYAFKDARRDKSDFPKRHMLHAYRLSFELFGKIYDFSAPLPKDFRELLESVDPVTHYDKDSWQSLVESH